VYALVLQYPSLIGCLNSEVIKVVNEKMKLKLKSDTETAETVLKFLHMIFSYNFWNTATCH